MASQRLTIAKICGKAAEVALSLFEEWQKARKTDDPSEWDAEQWPESVRLQADGWANALRMHGHEPPVLFYVEYVDLWSFCPPCRFLEDCDLMQVVANRFQLHCLRMPVGEPIWQRLAELSQEGQHEEDRWFGKVTLEALSSWDNLIRGGVLIFLREVLAGSIQDEAVEASMRDAPDWMRSREIPTNAYPSNGIPTVGGGKAVIKLPDPED